ncbi:cyclohexanone monooxygenase [Lophiotrema nucula]|uniref:Cyclohexanone monooxygenase n=1 Tax=Lophiotrema nucula TaxID=690887 RepID=A0A6A5YFV5_9PLEO|nr:cyclohexanone monooxygenase [Lophiotrema nucula]
MGSMPACDKQTYDVLIIGAGLSGICSLYHLRKRFPQWRIGCIEAGSDVGGVWHWNRYPGCRIDTESLSYAFSFDKELLQEWSWPETFSTQADMHAYIKRVAEKHDLYDDIRFNTRIKSASWDDDERVWTFADENNNRYTTRFFVSCLGFLSAPTLPAIEGVHGFRGQAFHTSCWPANLDIGRDFAGKNIGVIGTGATGIQTITALSKETSIKSLTVFQRTANWSAPLRNTKIAREQMEAVRNGGYEGIFQTCANSLTGFLHTADPRKTLEVTPEERVAHWEKLYNEPGFGKWLGVFSDTYTNREANTLYSEFMADKIRSRVNDSEMAQSLIPKNHGFGTRRVPLESGYYEAFNKPNVHLVDLQKTPIAHIARSSVVLDNAEEYEVDVLIYATGFDAITGAFSAVHWRAKNGRPLVGFAGDGRQDNREPIWPDHRPSTFLGLMAPAMPNTFMVLGPHQPFGNATRSVEHAVSVISDVLAFCAEKDYEYVEPEQWAVDEWTQHVVECSKGALANEVDSWMTGVNNNVKGKTVRSVARYSGSAIEYRRRCEECKQQGYKGLQFA